jgi:hypothetical protein
MAQLQLLPEPISSPGHDEQMVPSADMNVPLFDERFGLRLGRRTFYINVRIGTELRAKERLDADGHVHLSTIAFLYCVVCSGALMLFGSLCILYLLKSGLGINLSDGQSLLHPLYALFEAA